MTLAGTVFLPALTLGVGSPQEVGSVPELNPKSLLGGTVDTNHESGPAPSFVSTALDR